MTETERRRCFIFDVDGTIADLNSDVPYPHVVEWFKANYNQRDLFAFASNQGLVGYCVHKGADNRFPPTTDQMVIDRMLKLALALTGRADGIMVRVAYNLPLSDSGWAVPYTTDMDIEWDPYWRKPMPGMIYSILRAADIVPIDAIVVGDRETDLAAGKAAGTRAIYAKYFFGLEGPSDGGEGRE
jgi:beta-phosphoglucomutase-like phosphatase (HAD superfamily)